MTQSAVEYPKIGSVEITKTATIRVLHVDDDASFLQAAKPILEMQGAFQVDAASSVEEATEKIKEKVYDCVISDYVMSGKDGLQFLKQLRDRGNNIPFIIFTGKSREEVAIKALNLGADYYINKFGNPETVYGEIAHAVKRAVETRHAEQMLTESEEKYRSIVELAPDSIITFDMKGVITSVNNASTTMSGYSKDELVGKHFTKIGPVRVRDIPKYLQMLSSTLRGVVLKPFEVIYNHKDGTPRLGEVRFSFIKEMGRTVGLQAIMRDITERKKAEEALRESEARFRCLVEDAFVSVAITNKKGELTYVNKATADMLGYSQSEMVGQPFTNFLHPDDKGKVMRLFLKSILLRIQPRILEFRLVHKDGHALNMISKPTKFLMQGKTVGFQAISVDISERHATLEKLKVLNEKLSVVGSLTRHDIRNKLSSITNNIYLAKQTLPNDNKAFAYLGDSESAFEQIQKILDFAAIYEKLGAEELTNIDVEKSVDEAASLISDMQGIKVVNECHGLTVKADSLLRQLFYNLIHNSLKHGKTTRQIRVYYKDEKDELKLVYEDDGVGLPKTEKDRIFKEDREKNLRHGLYLIRKMCEVYGWTIQETGVQGKGAQFTITIPKTIKKLRELRVYF